MTEKKTGYPTQEEFNALPVYDLVLVLVGARTNAAKGIFDTGRTLILMSAIIKGLQTKTDTELLVGIIQLSHLLDTERVMHLLVDTGGTFGSRPPDATLN